MSADPIPGSVHVPGLSGAEVGNFIELLKKVLNNPTPNSDSKPEEEPPIGIFRTPLHEVDSVEGHIHSLPVPLASWLTRTLSCYVSGPMEDGFFRDEFSLRKFCVFEE